MLIVGIDCFQKHIEMRGSHCALHAIQITTVEQRNGSIERLYLYSHPYVTDAANPLQLVALGEGFQPFELFEGGRKTPITTANHRLVQETKSALLTTLRALERGRDINACMRVAGHQLRTMDKNPLGWWKE